MGESFTYQKDDLKIALLYDLRNRLVILQALKNEKKFGQTGYYSSKTTLENNFHKNLNDILKLEETPPQQTPTPAPSIAKEIKEDEAVEIKTDASEEEKKEKRKKLFIAIGAGAALLCLACVACIIATPILAELIAN